MEKPLTFEEFLISQGYRFFDAMRSADEIEFGWYKGEVYDESDPLTQEELVTLSRVWGKEMRKLGYRAHKFNKTPNMNYRDQGMIIL